MDNIERRVGKVPIMKKLLCNYTGIFEKINPIRIEEDHLGCFTYTCYSEYFDDVEEGHKIPHYEMQVIQNGKHLDIEFIKTDHA